MIFVLPRVFFSCNLEYVKNYVDKKIVANSLNKFVKIKEKFLQGEVFRYNNHLRIFSSSMFLNYYTNTVISILVLMTYGFTFNYTDHSS